MKGEAKVFYSTCNNRDFLATCCSRRQINNPKPADTEQHYQVGYVLLCVRPPGECVQYSFSLSSVFGLHQLPKGISRSFAGKSGDPTFLCWRATTANLCWAMYQNQTLIILLWYTVITNLVVMKAKSCVWTHRKHHSQQGSTVHLHLCERKYVFIPPVFLHYSSYSTFNREYL